MLFSTKRGVEGNIHSLFKVIFQDSLFVFGKRRVQATVEVISFPEKIVMGFIYATAICFPFFLALLTLESRPIIRLENSAPIDITVFNSLINQPVILKYNCNLILHRPHATVKVIYLYGFVLLP